MSCWKTEYLSKIKGLGSRSLYNESPASRINDIFDFKDFKNLTKQLKE
jgi:hypothetical protein